MAFKSQHSCRQATRDNWMELHCVVRPRQDGATCGQCSSAIQTQICVSNFVHFRPAISYQSDCNYVTIFTTWRTSTRNVVSFPRTRLCILVPRRKEPGNEVQRTLVACTPCWPIHYRPLLLDSSQRGASILRMRLVSSVTRKTSNLIRIA